MNTLQLVCDECHNPLESEFISIGIGTSLPVVSVKRCEHCFEYHTGYGYSECKKDMGTLLTLILALVDIGTSKEVFEEVIHQCNSTYSNSLNIEHIMPTIRMCNGA